MIDFEIHSDQLYSQVIRNKGIDTFTEACTFVQNLPYGRIHDRSKFESIVEENQGTCSSKHGFLAGLAEENGHPEVELMVGIFQMNGDSNLKLSQFFKDKRYSHIPEAHCYLRYEGSRYDFTARPNAFDITQLKFIREQRIEPHQAGEWKEVIHKDYIARWLVRNPMIDLTLEQIWTDRENCIRLLGQ